MRCITRSYIAAYARAKTVMSSNGSCLRRRPETSPWAGHDSKSNWAVEAQSQATRDNEIVTLVSRHVAIPISLAPYKYYTAPYDAGTDNGM